MVILASGALAARSLTGAAAPPHAVPTPMIAEGRPGTADNSPRLTPPPAAPGQDRLLGALANAGVKVTAVKGSHLEGMFPLVPARWLETDHGTMEVLFFSSSENTSVCDTGQYGQIIYTITAGGT